MLVDAQLLQAPAPDRYRFHDLLRAYAAERAVAEEPADLRDAAVRRILAWYLHTVAAVAQIVSPYRYRVPLPDAGTAGPPLTFTSLDQALDWCEMERANLLAATRQAALSGLYEFAWQLPVASLRFFNRRTYWAEWVETHQIALASARQIGDRRGEAMGAEQPGHRSTRAASPATQSAASSRHWTSAARSATGAGRPRPRPTWRTRTSA